MTVALSVLSWASRGVGLVDGIGESAQQLLHSHVPQPHHELVLMRMQKLPGVTPVCIVTHWTAVLSSLS